MNAFDPNDYTYNPYEFRYDSDGTVWAKVRAHAALTAKTPYKITINQYGYVSAALADETAYILVGVPAAAIASGEDGWLQIGGYCADVITPSLSVTAGHAFSILDGAVADSGVVFSGLAGQFAVCYTTSSSSTTQDMQLVPRVVLTTT